MGGRSWGCACRSLWSAAWRDATAIRVVVRALTLALPIRPAADADGWTIIQTPGCSAIGAMPTQGERRRRTGWRQTPLFRWLLLARRRLGLPPGDHVMNLLLILLIVLLLFGGGGFYFGGPAVGGSALGLILLIAIIVMLAGGFRSRV